MHTRFVLTCYNVIMKSLREYISEAEVNQKSLGHFNVATIDMLWAVFRAAQKASAQAGEAIPVIVGTTEGEREFFGTPQIVRLVQGLREEYQYPIFLNADHTYDIDKALAAVAAGYDMVIYDGNQVSHAENVENTKRVVVYKQEHNPECLIEAELGNIGSGSNIKDELPEGVSPENMTDPAMAKEFVTETGVDLLAPSVGNVHGVVTSGNPALDPERVQAIRESAGVPLVLHGGSGSSQADFRKVIAAGISVVHISTDMRVAYHEALKTSITETNELAPYRFLKSASQAVENVVYDKIKLFWGINN